MSESFPLADLSSHLVQLRAAVTHLRFLQQLFVPPFFHAEKRQPVLLVSNHRCWKQKPKHEFRLCGLKTHATEKHANPVSHAPDGDVGCKSHPQHGRCVGHSYFSFFFVHSRQSSAVSGSVVSQKILLMQSLTFSRLHFFCRKVGQAPQFIHSS